jgi:hypothetical protein
MHWRVGQKVADACSESQAKPLIAIAYIGGEAEDASKIDVTFDDSFHFLQRHASRGGDVGNPSNQAR